MKEKLWTKEFFIIALINFLLTMMYFLLMVTMSSYAVETYEAKISTAGLAASIFVLGSFVGRLLMARFTERFGLLKVLVLGLFGVVFASLGYFAANNITALLLIRILHGFTVGIVSTTTSTICVQIAPSSRKGEGISYYSLSHVLSSAIGPFIGAVLNDLNNGFTWMFALNIAAAFLCIVIIKLAGLQIYDEVGPAAKEGSNVWNVSNYIDKQAIPISLLMLAIGYCFSSVTSFLMLYGKETGLIEAAGYFFLIHSVCAIFSRPFTGKIMDVRGVNIIVYPCILLFSAGMFVYSQSTANWMLLIAAGCMGLGFGNFNSAAQLIAVKNADPARIGLATATYFIFLDLGFGLGPYILGHIIEGIGFRQLYMAASFICLICLPVYYLVYGNKEKHVYVGG